MFHPSGGAQIVQTRYQTQRGAHKDSFGTSSDSVGTPPGTGPRGRILRGNRQRKESKPHKRDRKRHKRNSITKNKGRMKTAHRNRRPFLFQTKPHRAQKHAVFIQACFSHQWSNTKKKTPHSPAQWLLLYSPRKLMRFMFLSKTPDV